MAYTRHLNPKMNFVLTQCTGTIDDNTLLIHLMSFQAESKCFEFIRELVDMRHLRRADRLTVQGLIRIAQRHRELFPGKDFMAAVFVKSTLFGKVAEVYSLLVNTMQLKVKVFSDEIDEPLAWLGYGADEIDLLKQFIGLYTRNAMKMALSS